MPNSETAKRVAREVRVAMLRAEVEQAQLAAALGLSQSAVSRRLTGEVPFDVNELQIVATTLHVSAGSLLSEPAVAEAIA